MRSVLTREPTRHRSPADRQQFDAWVDSLDGESSGGAGKDDTPIFDTPLLQAANFGPHTQRKVGG